MKKTKILFILKVKEKKAVCTIKNSKTKKDMQTTSESN